MAIPLTPTGLARRLVVAGAHGIADEFKPELEEAGREATSGVLAVIAGALAALVTRRLVKIIWRAATGTDDPDPANPATPWSVALGWTIAIGVGASVGGLVGRRLANQGYAKVMANR